jgi:integrase
VRSTAQRLPPAYEDRALLNVECPHHHRIIVWLLRYTGVRVAEAQGLRVGDVDLTPGHEALTVRGSKTAASSRTIPLLPQFLPLIQQHLEHIRQSMLVTSHTPVLPTQHGTPVTTN